MPQRFTVFALSDATGELAHNLAISVVKQFPHYDGHVARVPKIVKKEKIIEYVLKAKEKQGIIFFTFVSFEMRDEILRCAKQHDVVAIDILGPALDTLASYLHVSPSAQPGLQYKMTQNYFKRTEAVDFAVKHDDGLNLDSLDQSDIVILGVSRTSKTPLSIYLGYHGFRCSNVPLIKDIPLPAPVTKIARKKLIGLTIEPRKLVVIRLARLKKLGRSEQDDYASLHYVREDLAHAHSIFEKLKITPIDMTGRAIEEVASEVLNQLNLLGSA